MHILSPRGLVIAAVALVLVILGSAGALIALLHGDALERAENSLTNTASVVAEQLRHSIQAVDLVLAATVQDLGGKGATPGGLALLSAHERLRERAAALPELQGVAVIDASGTLRNHSRRFPPPADSYADREYFPIHRDRAQDGLHVGLPVIGRQVPVWQQIFSRRIEGPRGEFLGVVSAGLQADHGHAFYKTLGLGPGGRIMVFRADGMLTNTYPLAEGAMARSFAGDFLFTDSLMVRPSGASRRTGLIDASPRIVAYERLRDYPIVVAASSTESHLMKGWRETAAILGGGALLISAIVGVMTLLALREMKLSTSLETELLESGERLSGIIQSAMDAVITIDEKQRIVLFNAAAERIFQCPAAEAMGGPLDRFIPERFREAHRHHVERFGATGTTSRQMGGPSLQLAGLRKGGEEFPIDASISQVTAGGRKLYTVILRDITNRRRFEEALEIAYHERREAADQLRGILQSAMDAVITTDEDQKIILFNEAAERIFRCKAEHAMHGSLERFIPERFREAHREHLRRFGETRVTTRMMGPRRQLMGLRADGEEFPLDASISQVSVDGRKYYTVILRDITEQLAAEEALRRSFNELREMSAAMHDVREAERTRIARELHDELAQWLTAIKMDVTWLASRLPAEQPRLIERADKMKQLVDTTVTAVRRIAADLRPVMLDDLGLVPSIEHVVHTFSERTAVAVSLDIRIGDTDLHEPVATAVYRMVQEALTNVARHARATLVTVAVAADKGLLQVRVQDNGVGISDAPAAEGSHGVLGIRERARTLGGSARIYRPPEGGTVVEISIPLGRFRKPEAA